MLSFSFRQRYRKLIISTGKTLYFRKQLSGGIKGAPWARVSLKLRHAEYQKTNIGFTCHFFYRGPLGHVNIRHRFFHGY